MKSRLCLTALGLMLVFISYSFAQVPQMINYQGKLTSASGAPVTDTLQMVFTIYDAEVGGASLWTETQSAVIIEKGVFNVLLGSVNPISYSVFDGSTRYLGVQVGGDPEITPRKAMVSVPYAYRAGSGGGGSDDKWKFRITDTADTSITTGGNWGIARYGATLYGDMDSTHVNLGVSCTTGISTQSNKYCTVAGGLANTASESATTVAGGYHNRASGFISTVAGGDSNTANNNFATVGGGHNNTASGIYTIVAGGGYNIASGDYATVAGGDSNTTSGWYGTIGGGLLNTADGSGATISGGVLNSATSYGATVAGGEANLADHLFATIGGGYRNTVSGMNSMVACGERNLVAASYSAILGGYGDTITSTANHSYLFGIKSKLTQDSTFMVDMPHIRFGKETGGYEFPIYDGSPGAVLVTDGTGRASWVVIDTTDYGWVKYDTYVILASLSDSVGVGSTTPTAKLDVTGATGYNQVRMRTSYTPTGTSDTNGNVGDIAWDNNYFYVKTSAGWKRTALSTW